MDLNNPIFLPVKNYRIFYSIMLKKTLKNIKLPVKDKGIKEH